MFDKQEYGEMFSGIRASDGLTRRIISMKTEKQKRGMLKHLPRLMLAAVLIALLAVSVSAAETVQSWFLEFFGNRSETGLSQGQVEYIEDNAQEIRDAQTHDGWTVELQSAIQDGTTAYVVFRVKGPEGMDLSPWTDAQGNVLGNFIFGNMGAEAGSNGSPDVVSWSEGVNLESWSLTWANDNDGLANTRTLLIRLNPSMSRASVDPFGSEAVYTFHMENIVWESEDLEYYRELKNGKYAGQSSIMLTPEETARLYRRDMLAEGVWEFNLCFGDWEDDSDDYVELLDRPLTVRTNVFRSFGTEMEDFNIVEDTATLTSVRIRHLTVRFCYKSMQGTPEFELYDGENILRPVIVMKDGTQAVLYAHGNSGNGSVTMEAEIPVVFSDVSHILMPDGTIIPVPDATE